MPRLMLCGYYGFDNVGDTALLYSIITALRRIIPGVELMVMSNRPEETAAQYAVEAVNRWHMPSVWRELTRCDALVMGGGSLLQDVTGLKSLIYYLGVIRMAQLAGKQVFFYAQGIGPITTATGRFLTRRVVNRVNYITVRDRDSAEELKRIGVSKPPVTLCSDPVLGLILEPERVKAQKEGLSRLGIDLNRTLIGISVRPWENWEAIRQAVAQAADALAEAGCEIVFIPMQPPADTKASREVAALMKRKAVVLTEVSEVSDIAGVVANLDLMIGMRLHSLILAAAAGVPLVGVSYDPKVDAFLAQIGKKPATSSRSPRSQDIVREATSLISDLTRAHKELEAAVEPLRREAYLPATILSSLL